VPVLPRRGERLIAFFACLYFAMLRPSEALALCAEDCILPTTGWGRLELHPTKPTVGKQWTDTGDSHEDWSLKNRPRRSARMPALAGPGLSVFVRLERSEAPAPDSPGRGVHAALARQWVDLSPLQMWVLPDCLPACRGPTIACMGLFDDLPARGLRLRESAPAGPVLYPFAGAGGPHWFVSRWRTRPGGNFVPDSGLSAVPC
jgi:hypothetical protein